MQPDDSEAPAESEQKFVFEDMRLRVGSRIQLQLPPSLGAERHLVKLIGYMENISLMVTTPVSNSVWVHLLEHEKVVARIFSSQKAFAFDSLVMRTNTLPFHYVHLSFPEKIHGSVIRKSARINTKIMAKSKNGRAGNDQNQRVLITNLSNDGAMIETPDLQYQKGENITLSFQAILHGKEIAIVAKAIVCNVMAEKSPGGGPHKYSHGLAFLDLPPDHKMTLQNLIYQQMIEDPNSVI